MIHIIYISVIILLIYTIINLFIKNSKLETILVTYLEYLDKISKAIELSEKKINELDTNKMFSSDDEAGFFFKTIKEIQDILNSFILKKIPNESPKKTK